DWRAIARVWFFVWLWALALVLLSLPGAASEPVQESSAPVADEARSRQGEIRTGTTSVEPPVEPTVPAPSSKDVAEHAPPGDSPRLTGPALRLPDAPASFTLYDGGWIRFAYPPSVRERVQPLIGAADDARAELTAWLGQPVLKKVTVYVARTPGEMASLA